MDNEELKQKGYENWGKELDYKMKLKQAEKLTYDIELAKKQVKTYWVLFALAIIGGVSGIISLIVVLLQQ